jgi:heterodisulfide reductase subunit A
MLETNRHPNIEILSYSEVTEIDGYIGNFEVKVKRKARFVLEDKCTGCGTCTDVCPVYTSNYFDEYLSARKVIDMAFAQAVPAISQLDRKTCVECFACVDACEQEAIDFSQQDEIIELKVGTIVVATGWDLYKGDDYGYGNFENVINQIELERILAPNGPTYGHLKRPSDGKRPTKVLFINCVGSRDINKNAHCSVICCNLSLKNSKLIKSEYPDSQIVVTYIDMRCAGKDYEEYYRRSRDAGIIFVKGLVGDITEDPLTKNLTVQFEPVGTDSVMERSPDGFLKEYHARLDPISTKVPGIFICGSSQGQKEIDKAVSQARGAASVAGIPMGRGEYTMELIRATPSDERCAKCYKCIEACPYSAISINETGNIIVDLINCRGCGTCAGLCPSKAIDLTYFRDVQYMALVDQLLPLEE